MGISNFFFDTKQAFFTTKYRLARFILYNVLNIIASVIPFLLGALGSALQSGSGPQPIVAGTPARPPSAEQVRIERDANVALVFLYGASILTTALIGLLVFLFPFVPKLKTSRLITIKYELSMLGFQVVLWLATSIVTTIAVLPAFQFCGSRQAMVFLRLGFMEAGMMHTICTLPLVVMILSWVIVITVSVLFAGLALATIREGFRGRPEVIHGVSTTFKFGEVDNDDLLALKKTYTTQTEYA